MSFDYIFYDVEPQTKALLRAFAFGKGLDVVAQLL